MRSCITWLMLAHVFIGVAMGQTSKLADAKVFSDVFVKTAEVKLDFGDEQVGIIDQVYVGSNGNFLLLDRKFNEVYLIGTNGRLIKKINIENDIPGYLLQPVAATFFRDGSFLIYNAPMSLLFFDKAGCFVRRHRFMNINNYRSFSAGVDGVLYGYTTSEKNVFITKMDTSKCNVLSEFGEYPDGHLGFIYRVGEGGAVYVDDENRVFQTHVSSPDLYIYNQNLALQSVVRLRPPFFNEYPKEHDNKFKDTSDLPGMIKIMKAQSLNLSILPLNGKIILLQCRIPKEGYALIFYDKTTGREVVPRSLRYTEKIVTARNNKVYTVLQPDDETVFNPVLVEYQIKSY